MYFPTFLKIFSFLSVINFFCLSSESDEDQKLTKYEKLEECLVLAGVDHKNIVYRTDENFDELNWQWNRLNNIIKPLAYVVANSVSDVQTAVKCCKSTNVRIVPRSGGHSYVKNGFGDSNSLIVDLSKLNKIKLNRKEMTVEIEPGNRNGRMNHMTSREKFLIPVGICPTVGIGGYALGGGFGYFSRMYGITSDHIIEMEMVDAKGDLLVINNTTNIDLFYALRGGGAGSYGIVTKFKLKMYRAPESIVFGTYYYQYKKDFLQFYQAYQKFIKQIPKRVGSIVFMKDDMIEFEVYYINATPNKISKAMIKNIVVSCGFPETTNNTIQILSYPEFLLKVTQFYSDKPLKDTSQMAAITRENHVGWKKVKSFYVSRLLNQTAIYNFYVVLATFLDESSSLALLQNGGEMNKFSRTETAFVHRGHLYDIQMQAYNLKHDSSLRKLYLKTKDIFDHSESYQNYLDGDEKRYLERYYQENLSRLVDVKKRVDPENIFHHPQSIPTKIKFR